MKKIITSFCILTLSLFFFACAAKSDFMVKTDKSKMKLEAKKSRVVFIRPSSGAFGLAPAIIDQDGKYIGESTPSSYFYSDLEPGNYTFIAWAEGTHSMKANLKSGKTYYVKVTPHIGAWAARFHLDAIKKDSKDWKEKEKWMTELPLYIPNVAEGQKKIIDKKGKDSVNSTVEKGKKRFVEYDDKEKKEKSLFPEDGE